MGGGRGTYQVGVMVYSRLHNDELSELGFWANGDYVYCKIDN